MLASDFDNALETARNGYSCALACIVSLSRAIGRPITQGETIAVLTDKIPSWRERPGGLALEMTINMMMGTLETTAHIITADPNPVLRYWNKPERLGGVVVTGRQPTKTGTALHQNHAWRLMNCDEQQLVLMNPKPSGATIETVRWDFLTTWKGYFVLLE
jgi:hypothetical protein